MASPHSFHERADPVSDTAGSFFRFRLQPPPPALFASGPRPPPSAYAFCSLAVSVDSMVKMAS